VTIIAGHSSFGMLSQTTSATAKPMAMISEYLSIA
jgi:hypothetical protein